MAERKVGRRVVIDAMAPTMVSATNFTADALDVFRTRLALAKLIGNCVEDDARIF